MKYHTDPAYLQQQAYSDARDLNVRTHIMQHYRSHSLSWYRWLFDNLALPPNGRILELGCGPGHLWRQNVHRLLPGWHLYLSDFSPGMLEEARNQLYDKAPFHFAVLDATALSFPSDTFEVVLAFGLLDHLSARRQTLTQVRRVLRPGGLFYTSAGAQDHLQEIESLVRPFLPDTIYGGDPERFGLHNGAHFLAPFFTEVQQQTYETFLVFQEAAPLVAYVLSEPKARRQFTPSQLAAFQGYIDRELASQGEIRVTVKKGIFSSKLGGDL